MRIERSSGQTNALVVDDHAGARWLVSQALCAIGYSRVWEASSSIAALRYCDALPFDVAIVDLLLGEEDGVDLIDALRHRPGSVGKIIAVSADATRLKNAASRADALLAKPLDAEAFVRAVGRPNFANHRSIDLDDKSDCFEID